MGSKDNQHNGQRQEFKGWLGYEKKEGGEKEGLSSLNFAA